MTQYKIKTAFLAHLRGYIFRSLLIEPTHNQKVPGSSPGGPTLDKAPSLLLVGAFSCSKIRFGH